MPEIDLEAPRPSRPAPWTAERLQAAFPGIAWREPVMVEVMGVEGRAFVCRVCVANEGLSAEALASVLRGVDPGRRASVPHHLHEEGFLEHMLAAHPKAPDPSLPPPGAVPTMPKLRKPPGV